MISLTSPQEGWACASQAAASPAPPPTPHGKLLWNFTSSLRCSTSDLLFKGGKREPKIPLGIPLGLGCAYRNTWDSSQRLYRDIFITSNYIPHLDAEALRLDKRQSNVLVILPSLLDEIHFLTQVLLKMFLCCWVHHGSLYLWNCKQSCTVWLSSEKKKTLSLSKFCQSL